MCMYAHEVYTYMYIHQTTCTQINVNFQKSWCYKKKRPLPPARRWSILHHNHNIRITVLLHSPTQDSCFPISWLQMFLKTWWSSIQHSARNFSIQINTACMSSSMSLVILLSGRNCQINLQITAAFHQIECLPIFPLHIIIVLWIAKTSAS